MVLDKLPESTAVVLRCSAFADTHTSASKPPPLDALPTAVRSCLFLEKSSLLFLE